MTPSPLAEQLTAFRSLGGAEPRLAADQALALLVDGIRAESYEIGDALPPLRMLARELGVSHVVARRAIDVLEACNVLTVRAGRSGGIFLTGIAGIPEALSTLYRTPSQAEVVELLQARRLLEADAACRASRLRSDDQVLQLNQVVDQMHGSSTLPEFVELTVRFHIKMAVAAGNPVLTGFSREILNRLATLGWKSKRSRLRPPPLAALKPLVPTYQALTDAIAAQDPTDVKRLVDEHINSIATSYQLTDEQRRRVFM